MAQQPSARAPGKDPAAIHEMGVDELKAELAELAKQEELRDLRAQLAAKKAAIVARATAREAVPAQDDVRDSPDCWILLPEAADEQKYALQWVEAHCPVKLEQRMVADVLDLLALRDTDSVICMVRNLGGARRTALEVMHTTHEGERISSPRPKEDVFPEIALTRAVHCRDHWMVEPTGRFAGKLNFDSFVNALGQLTTPLSPRFLDVTEKNKQAHKMVLRNG